MREAKEESRGGLVVTQGEPQGNRGEPKGPQRGRGQGD